MLQLHSSAADLHWSTVLPQQASVPSCAERGAALAAIPETGACAQLERLELFKVRLLECIAVEVGCALVKVPLRTVAAFGLGACARRDLRRFITFSQIRETVTFREPRGSE